MEAGSGSSVCSVSEGVGWASAESDGGLDSTEGEASSAEDVLGCYVSVCWCWWWLM